MTAAAAAARPWWVGGLTLAFFSMLAYFAWRYAHTIAWQDVQQTLAATPAPTLVAASVMAAISHAIYSSFDLLGRAYTGHRLRAAQVMGITFISYAFSLTLGALVGGVGLRLRLYTRLGLSALTATRVFTFSVVTNWFGFLVLAGTVFALAPPPIGTGLSAPALHGLGLVLLGLAAGYVGLCLRTRQRLVRLFRHAFRLPGPRLVALQLALSCTHWASMGGVLYFLLQTRVDYVTVLGVLLVAAVAGAVTHIPAGLGVLEAVFLALLSDAVPAHVLLAALLAYRAIYYLVPFLLAAALYGVIEARGRVRLRGVARDTQKRPPPHPRH
jgi:uncharacterized membrane protein YbhN (UPF0104 family)